jgi:hemerythrin
MERITWHPEYETGIKIIDEQHQELFRIMDKFAIAIYDGEGKNKLEQLLLFLDDYTHVHFKTEEELLALNNYEEYDEHIKTHRDFVSLFHDFQDEFDNRGGDSYLAMRLDKEIRNWWENHILKTDMQYVPYIEKLSGS